MIYVDIFKPEKKYLILNWFVQVENKYDFFNLLTVYGYILHFCNLEIIFL